MTFDPDALQRAAERMVEAIEDFFEELLKAGAQPRGRAQTMASSAAQTSPGALLTPEQLAEYINVSIGTVYQWRARRVGPRGVRVAGGLVRFRKSDVDAWLDAQADQ